MITVKKGIRCMAAVLLAVAVCMSAGCKEKRENTAEESGYCLYYLNQSKTKIVNVDYEPEAQDAVGQIEEMIGKLGEDTGSLDYRKVFPDSVSIDRYEYADGQLYLYFSNTYAQIPSAEEVLCRGAIVHTMMQIDGVKGVTFYVDNLPLTDARGMEVGTMTNDSFVENPGEKINNIQETDLNLYFASADGSGLVSESQHVYYSSNISTEKLIMERLLAGPKSENARSAIPSGTGLISVSVMDGVCFVNLDENFLAQDFEIREEVVIYSIVDSLTELPTVDTVQISVNGETNLNYREHMSLTESYLRNLDLLTGQGDEVEIVQEEEETAGKRMEGLIDSGE